MCKANAVCDNRGYQNQSKYSHNVAVEGYEIIFWKWHQDIYYRWLSAAVGRRLWVDISLVKDWLHFFYTFGHFLLPVLPGIDQVRDWFINYVNVNGWSHLNPFDWSLIESFAFILRLQVFLNGFLCVFIQERHLIRGTEGNRIVIVLIGEVDFSVTDIAVTFPLFLQLFHNIGYFLALNNFQVTQTFFIFLNLALNVGDQSDFIFIYGLNKGDEWNSFLDVFTYFNTDFCCDQLVIDCF